jgi:hypothetical protein
MIRDFLYFLFIEVVLLLPITNLLVRKITTTHGPLFFDLVLINLDFFDLTSVFIQLVKFFFNNIGTCSTKRGVGWGLVKVHSGHLAD